MAKRYKNKPKNGYSKRSVKLVLFSEVENATLIICLCEGTLAGKNRCYFLSNKGFKTISLAGIFLRPNL